MQALLDSGIATVVVIGDEAILPDPAPAAPATPVVSAPATLTDRVAPTLAEGEAAPHGDDRVTAFVTKAIGKHRPPPPAAASYARSARPPTSTSCG